MKRFGAGSLAGLFAASFLFACLAPCLTAAPVSADDHACCPKEGWSAPARDCCAVTPGVNEDAGHPTLGQPIVIMRWIELRPLPVFDSMPAAPSWVSLAPSPPSILRV